MADRVRNPNVRDPNNDSGRGRSRSWGGAVVRAFATLLLIAGVFFGGGFVWFAINALTARPPAIYETDAIVVLTGGSRRIEAALSLLAEGAGERLLISGVNPSTTAESIRKTVDGDVALFECCVDIGYEALDTYGNAVETSKWIAENDYRRVLVVTSAYHLPRSLFELRHIDPGTIFVGYPVPIGEEPRNLVAIGRYAKLLGAEYMKFIGAHVRALTGWKALEPAGGEQQGGAV
ncbi:YdcF family protein [Martelella endophytica]|uniref:YdcF family protein n=1 Tax=Martelella endophytica TaxID=1486262 RepID=UPI0006991628|nr:YdcF family protein [Martelella endophytica]